MERTIRVKNIGLRGVPVADTRISFIDGHKGILLYRGFRIEDLAEKATFPEVVYLLLNGKLPTREALDRFNREMAAARALPDFLLETLRLWPGDADPMDVLMASLPLLALADPELAVESRAANVRKAMRLLTRMPGLLAAWHQIRNGRALPVPDPSLSPAADFLGQFRGRRVDDADMVRALDVSMILQAEHTFNASTFACREVASTGAHMYAAVGAGIGALSGSLHGGANAKVLEMLFRFGPEMESREEIDRWVKERLDRREKIMGMGHAVYKTFDPRSLILREHVRRLSAKTGFEPWYRKLHGIEEACHREFERRGKPGIKSNVDFYTGLLYTTMGFPVDFMTPLFALSLAAGWCAHIIEEKFGEAQEEPALYSPSADYVGEYCGARGCPYMPIEAR